MAGSCLRRGGATGGGIDALRNTVDSENDVTGDATATCGAAAAAIGLARVANGARAASARDGKSRPPTDAIPNKPLLLPLLSAQLKLQGDAIVRDGWTPDGCASAAGGAPSGASGGSGPGTKESEATGEETTGAGSLGEEGGRAMVDKDASRSSSRSI